MFFKYFSDNNLYRIFFNNLKNFVYFIPEKTKSCGHKTVLITATGN